MQLQQRVLEIDNEKIVCEMLLRKDNVAILHGAGVSSKKDSTRSSYVEHPGVDHQLVGWLYMGSNKTIFCRMEKAFFSVRASVYHSKTIYIIAATQGFAI